MLDITIWYHSPANKSVPKAAPFEVFFAFENILVTIDVESSFFDYCIRLNGQIQLLEEAACFGSSRSPVSEETTTEIRLMRWTRVVTMALLLEWCGGNGCSIGTALGLD